MRALLLVALSGCAVTTAAGPGAAPSRAPEAAHAADATPAEEAAPAADAALAADAGPVAELVAVPGGRMSRDARTCDAADDHCLRAETWFLEKSLGKMHTLEAVFWAEGAWRKWSSGGVVEGGPAHRTRPATIEDLAIGTQVIFRGNGKVATNESEAHAHWSLETVLSIDADKGTFEWGRGSHPMPIDLARVIVETR